MITGKQHRIEMAKDFGPNAAKDIAGALNALLADAYALLLKAKNFHWHVSGPNASLRLVKWVIPSSPLD